MLMRRFMEKPKRSRMIVLAGFHSHALSSIKEVPNASMVA